MRKTSFSFLALVALLGLGLMGQAGAWSTPTSSNNGSPSNGQPYMTYASPSSSSSSSSSYSSSSPSYGGSSTVTTIQNETAGVTSYSDAMIARELAEAAKVSATGATAKIAPIGGRSEVYLTLQAKEQGDRLISVNTPWAHKAGVFATAVDEKEVTSLVEMKGLLLAPHEQVRFAPGGMVIILSDLTRELASRQRFPLNLVFEKSGVVRVLAVVEAKQIAFPGAGAPPNR